MFVGVFGGVVCLFVEVYILEPSSTGACYSEEKRDHMIQKL